jgi:hypothetical protein
MKKMSRIISGIIIPLLLLTSIPCLGSAHHCSNNGQQLEKSTAMLCHQNDNKGSTLKLSHECCDSLLGTCTGGTCDCTQGKVQVQMVFVNTVVFQIYHVIETYNHLEQQYQSNIPALLNKPPLLILA